MNKKISQWVLTDTERNIWVETLELGAAELGVAAPARISKRVLHGGLQEGVELVEVDNGALSFSILPTRGMGLWRGSYRGEFIGWRSPVRGPVHPQFVHANERSGLGWLQGFDECIVRCGLESNGAPGVDILPGNTGEPVPMQLGLHGRIANLPAHYVAVEVGREAQPVLRVRGVVDEAALFLPQLRLTSCTSTVLGLNALLITDEIENRKPVPAEMQLLYHCNFGAPFMDAGARLLLPRTTTAPRDATAAAGLTHWDIYREPTPGYIEQVYFHRPHSAPDGSTMALLHNAAGTRGVLLRYNTHQLPCFTQWKQGGSQSEGYVTGLEPATNYPNQRATERRHGRVVTLQPGEIYRVELRMEVLLSAAEVHAAGREVAALQAGVTPQVSRLPLPDFS